MDHTVIVEDKLNKLRQDPSVDSFLNELQACGPSLIFGGAVRDWILDKPFRDLDIVVDCSPEKLEFLSKYRAQKNRFGGYYLKLDELEFDIWAMEGTWALKQDSSFEKKLSTIPRTAFQSVDAIGYQIDTKTIYENGFYQSMSSKELDIIYEPNPFPFHCVSKALGTLVKYDLKPSTNLKRYFDIQMGKGYNEKAFIKYRVLRSFPFEYQECIERIK